MQQSQQPEHQNDPEKDDKQHFTFGTFKRQKQLVPLHRLKVHASDVFSLRFDQEDNFLAAGMADGSVEVFIESRPPLIQTNRNSALRP